MSAVVERLSWELVGEDCHTPLELLSSGRWESVHIGHKYRSVRQQVQDGRKVSILTLLCVLKVGSVPSDI